MSILNILLAYLLLGCGFGVIFFLIGYAALNPEAKNASKRVRLLWTPAAIALWPLLTYRWLRQNR